MEIEVFPTPDPKVVAVRAPSGGIYLPAGSSGYLYIGQNSIHSRAVDGSFPDLVEQTKNTPELGRTLIYEGETIALKF